MSAAGAAECRDCHRPLRARESRERGYGRQCWQDHKPAATAPLPIIPTRHHHRTGQPYPDQIALFEETEHA